jgi:hypothetical protein
MDSVFEFNNEVPEGVPVTLTTFYGSVLKY